MADNNSQNADTQARKRATKKAATKKSATKRATKKSAAGEKTNTTTTKKAATKKVAPKKTATRTSPKEIVPRQGDVKQIVGKVQTFAGNAAHSTGELAREGLHSAGVLAGQAKTKVKRLTESSKRFIKEHPTEAAGIAAAGLTVVAAALGRKAILPAAKGAAKGVAGAALLAKATKAVKGLTKR